MPKLVLRSMAVAISAALAGACGDETIIYPGGPAGPASGIAASRGLVVLHAGESVTIGLRAVDDSGNTATGTAPSISSCDAGIASVTGGGAVDPWTSSAEVSGVALGQTCLVASAGSVPPETVRVNVGPRLMNIVGPDTVLSGASGSFTMAFTDATGATVAAPATGFPGARVTSGNLLRMVVAPPGDVVAFSTAGQQPGAVTLSANLGADHGGATARKSVTVVPGMFGGSLSATSADPGTVITVTRAASGHPFDADSKVTLGTLAVFVDSWTADVLRFPAPAIGSTAAATLLLSDMGPFQVAQTTQFTSTKAAEDVYSPGNLDATCAGPATAPDYNTMKSPGGWIYLTHNGTSQGTRGCFNGSTGPDHYILYTTGAADEVIDVEARWSLAGDNDIYVCTTDLAECPGAGFSGGTLAELEAVDVELTANTSYYIIYSPWTANTGTNHVRIKITPG